MEKEEQFLRSKRRSIYRCTNLNLSGPQLKYPYRPYNGQKTSTKNEFSRKFALVALGE